MEFPGQEDDINALEFQSHSPKPLSQHGLNYLVGYLDLTKQQSELLAPR